MGDISIKGRSPILTKGQRLLSRGISMFKGQKVPRGIMQKQKAVKVEKHTVEKPEPQPQLPTKKQ